MLSENSNLDLEVQGKSTKYFVVVHLSREFFKRKRKENKKRTVTNKISKSQQKLKNGLLELRVVLSLHFVTVHVPLTLPTWPPDQHISGDGCFRGSTMTVALTQTQSADLA